jgi:hypothetical protein
MASWPRRLLLWTMMLAIPPLVTAALAEALLRAGTAFGYSTFVFRRYDEVLGTTLIADVQGKHQRCYDGYVSINAYGMRDGDRTPSKAAGAYRIGIFGDSLTEAVHVLPDQTASFLLEKALNDAGCDGRCEVLNFSVGSYSTVQEYLRYVTLGRRFDLDLAILVVIPNDLIANVDPGDPMAGSLYSAPHLVPEGGTFHVVRPPPLSPSFAALEYLARRSALVLYGTKVYYHALKPALQKLLASAPPSTDSARTPDDVRWPAFRHVVQLFNTAAKEDGAQFAVAFIDVENGFWERRGESPSQEPPRMAKELGEAALEAGFSVHDLGADIARYVRDHRLAWPYLSFNCDSHYTARGQKVIADSVFEFLTARRLAPVGQPWAARGTGGGDRLVNASR